eukprot:432660-Pleurochrysis_carterae.AAC.2
MAPYRAAQVHCKTTRKFVNSERDAHLAYRDCLDFDEDLSLLSSGHQVVLRFPSHISRAQAFRVQSYRMVSFDYLCFIRARCRLKQFLKSRLAGRPRISMAGSFTSAETGVLNVSIFPQHNAQSILRCSVAPYIESDWKSSRDVARICAITHRKRSKQIG